MLRAVSACLRSNSNQALLSASYQNPLFSHTHLSHLTQKQQNHA